MCVRDAGVTWEKKSIQRLALKGVALQCLKCFVSFRDPIENAELATSTPLMCGPVLQMPVTYVARITKICATKRVLNCKALQLAGFFLEEWKGWCQQFSM